MYPDPSLEFQKYLLIPRKGLDKGVSSGIVPLNPNARLTYGNIIKGEVIPLWPESEESEFPIESESESEEKIDNKYREAWIIISAIGVVFLLLALDGFGEPNRGQELSDAAPALQQALEALAAAYPDLRQWSGSAADAYTAQLKVINNQLAAVQELDQQIRDAINTHATKNLATRRALASLLGFLGMVLAVVIWLIRAGQPSQTLQITAASIALTGAATAVGIVVNSSNAREDTAKKAGKHYLQTQAAAHFSRTQLAIPTVGQAPDSTLNAFSRRINRHTNHTTANTAHTTEATISPTRNATAPTRHATQNHTTHLSSTTHHDATRGTSGSAANPIRTVHSGNPNGLSHNNKPSTNETTKPNSAAQHGNTSQHRAQQHYRGAHAGPTTLPHKTLIADVQQDQQARPATAGAGAPTPVHTADQ